jgi:NAD(P)-dependent dehydrogenase (short-subunit alcohol dehydrogenase family)
MIGWATINPALIRLFTALAQPNEAVPVTNWSGEWQDRAVKATSTTFRQALYLRVATVVAIAEDDRRLEYITDPTDPFYQQLRETIYGLRRVTLNVRCDVSDNLDGVSATATLERIRTRLSRRRSIDALLAVNVGIVSAETIRDISKTSELRVRSIGSMDVILTMVASDVDPVPTGWVQTIIIQSGVRDTDDSALLPSFAVTVTS